MSAIPPPLVGELCRIMQRLPARTHLIYVSRFDDKPTRPKLTMC